jgi:hypothetical protein
MKTYSQKVLIGRLQRPADMVTKQLADNETRYEINYKWRTIATRTTTAKRREEATIISLAKAVKGITYIFKIKVNTNEKPDLKVARD